MRKGTADEAEIGARRQHASRCQRLNPLARFCITQSDPCLRNLNIRAPSIMPTESGGVEYAPGGVEYVLSFRGATWRELFLKSAGWPKHLKTLPRWCLWSLEALLAVTFVLAAWGFISGLINCWADGWW